MNPDTDPFQFQIPQQYSGQFEAKADDVSLDERQGGEPLSPVDEARLAVAQAAVEVDADLSQGQDTASSSESSLQPREQVAAQKPETAVAGRIFSIGANLDNFRDGLLKG